MHASLFRGLIAVIFAQYKHAITFAVVILGFAVLVADPGRGDADDTAPAQQADAAASLAAAPAPEPQAAPAAADAEWYGVADDTTAPPVEDAVAAEDAGYDIAPTPAPPSQSRTVAVPVVPAAPGYVPPPPPPQVPPGR